MMRFEKELVEASERGVSINIAMLNPDSPFAEQRTRDLRQSDGFVSQAIKRNTHEIQTICINRSLTTIELKYYSSFPSGQFYIFDDEAYVAFYLYGIESSRV